MRQQDISFDLTPDPLDSALTRALEAPPQPAVPADFALRVLSRLPAETLRAPGRLRLPQSISEPHIGRRTAFAAAALLLAAFILVPLLTPHTAAAHQFAYLAVGAVFAAEFILITVWLSLRPDTLR